jgi:hypothetical protein
VPLFYFHLHDRFGSVPDPEARELADLEVVRAQALKGARSIISEDVGYGRIDLTGRIDVCDEAGELVLSLPFRDAVELVLDEDGDSRTSPQ